MDIEQEVEELDVDQVEDEPETVEDPFAEEAERFGWKPAEDWKGDGHMSAENFMLRGPGTSRKAIAETDNLRRELASVQNSQARNTAAIKAAADERYNQRVAQFENAKRKAVAEGDTEAYDKIHDAQLKEAPKEPEGPTQADQDAITAWAGENAWYKTDPVMQGVANTLWQQAETSGIHDVVGILAYVSDNMKTEMPHKFEKPKPQRRVAAVDDGGMGAGGGRSKTKGWRDVPASDKRMAEEQISEGLFDALAESMKVTPQEAFAKIYHEDV